MSDKMEVKQGCTVCDHEVIKAMYMELTEIIKELFLAYSDSLSLADDFSEGYEGEAKEEVAAFLQNLPTHLYRLGLFYGKMAQFLDTMNLSFETNDRVMAGRQAKERGEGAWKQKG